MLRELRLRKIEGLYKLKLTDKGISAYRVHEKFHHDIIAGMISGLNEEEKTVLASALTNVNDYLKSCENI